jgi:hypothetical protein
MVTFKRFEKTDLIPLRPPFSKGGSGSPPFDKGRLGGILQDDFKNSEKSEPILPI